MGTTDLVGKQTFPLAREIQVLQGANRVLGSSHLGEWSFHGSGQGHRSPRVVYSGKQDGRPGFPRLCKLLLKVHSRLLHHSSTPLWPDTLWTSLDVEWKRKDGLWGPQNSGNHCSNVNVPSGLKSLFRLKQTARTLPQEQSCLNSQWQMENSTLWYSTASPCSPWNGTMKSMTRKC